MIVAIFMYFCIAEPLIGRVVYRGNNNANANGGVSYANANNAPSNSNTNIGSRLNYNQRKIIIGVQQRERVSRRRAEGGEQQQ